MIDDRELVIKFQKRFVEEELSHWEGVIIFDGEQVYEERGAALREVADKVYGHVWETDSVIPEVYRSKKLDGLLTPLFGDEEDG